MANIVNELPESVITRIDNFISDNYSDRKSLGRGIDKRYNDINRTWTNTERFDNFLIGFRLCSPAHRSEMPSVYWFLIID